MSDKNITPSPLERDGVRLYKIDGHQFKLKDLTLDEADEVDSMLITSKNVIKVKKGDTKKFLKQILEPVSRTPLRGGDKGVGSEVDFGKTTESTATEVLVDFFTNRKKNRLVIINSIVDLPELLKKSSENIKT